MNNLSVIMYHYVRKIKNSRYPGIKGLEFDDFVEQIKFLKRNYNVVSMEEVIASYDENHILPPNPALLTFDDGYAEHFSHVYPILKRYQMQGSFYIPAKTVQENVLLDVNKIHFILASCADPQKLVKEIEQQIDFYRKDYQLKDFDCYYKEFAVANRFDSAEIIFVKRILQHGLPEELRNIISDALFVRFVGIDEAAFSKELYMDKAQIHHMVDDGMHVGSHGYDHYWWNKLDAIALENEINCSLSFLGQVGVNMNNWTACYPYGSSSKKVVSTLKSKGCRLAFTTQVNTTDLSIENPLLIPRLDTNDLPKEHLAATNKWYEI
jgi:peptidoglycan/xylan/chitin deacetylase (PgdA/CDA1 family)